MYSIGLHFIGALRSKLLAKFLRLRATALLQSALLGVVDSTVEFEDEHVGEAEDLQVRVVHGRGELGGVVDVGALLKDRLRCKDKQIYTTDVMNVMKVYTWLRHWAWRGITELIKSSVDVGALLEDRLRCVNEKRNRCRTYEFKVDMGH